VLILFPAKEILHQIELEEINLKVLQNFELKVSIAIISEKEKSQLNISFSQIEE
jgi:hypothetical protein